MEKWMHNFQAKAEEQVKSLLKKEKQARELRDKKAEIINQQLNLTLKSVTEKV